MSTEKRYFFNKNYLKLIKNFIKQEYFYILLTNAKKRCIIANILSRLLDRLEQKRGVDA